MDFNRSVTKSDMPLLLTLLHLEKNLNKIWLVIPQIEARDKYNTNIKWQLWYNVSVSQNYSNFYLVLWTAILNIFHTLHTKIDQKFLTSRLILFAHRQLYIHTLSTKNWKNNSVLSAFFSGSKLPHNPLCLIQTSMENWKTRKDRWHLDACPFGSPCYCLCFDPVALQVSSVALKGKTDHNVNVHCWLAFQWTLVSSGQKSDCN